MFNRSKHMKKIWLIARLRLQSGLTPLTNYRPKKQLRIVMFDSTFEPELYKEEINNQQETSL